MQPHFILQPTQDAAPQEAIRAFQGVTLTTFLQLSYTVVVHYFECRWIGSKNTKIWPVKCTKLRCKKPKTSCSRKSVTALYCCFVSCKVLKMHRRKSATKMRISLKNGAYTRPTELSPPYVKDQLPNFKLKISQINLILVGKKTTFSGA